MAVLIVYDVTNFLSSPASQSFMSPQTITFVNLGKMECL